MTDTGRAVKAKRFELETSVLQCFAISMKKRTLELTMSSVSLKKNTLAFTMPVMSLKTILSLAMSVLLLKS